MMRFIQPTTWADALAAKAEYPHAVPVCGGTDIMVELNFDLRRPEVLLDLTKVDRLRDWSRDNGRLRLGAGVTYTRLIDELAGPLPGLAIASRTVGSPQIRNRGTVGGNLGSASPAGDAHPPLLATDAVVQISSVNGTRQLPVSQFYTGVKRHTLQPDELIEAILLEPATGPQQFAKVGTRNAMVIAVCSFAVALHPGRHAVGTGIGSAAPTPRRATEAEEFAAQVLDEHGLWQTRQALPESAARRFGQLVGEAASPIDDVRGTAAYRRHALSILGQRTLTWAWDDYRKTGRT